MGSLPLLAWRPSQTTTHRRCEIRVDNVTHVAGETAVLRDVWEEPAFMLERLQCAEECVEAEQKLQRTREAPVWKLPFKPTFTPADKLNATEKVGGG